MLAQSWLYGRRMPSPHDALVEKRLRLPAEFNPHSSVVVLNQLAERIVFTDDVPSLLYEMHDNRQLTYEGMLTSARLPYDCFWLEYKSIIGFDGFKDIDRAEYGALVVKHHDGARLYIVIGTPYQDLGTVSGLVYVVEFNVWPPVLHAHPKLPEGVKKALSFDVLYAYNDKRIKNEEEKAIDTLGGIVTELIFGIFLVTQPRTYHDEAVKWHPKKQAARTKHGKPPLLEYRRIRMRITKPVKRYAAQATATRGINTSITHELDTEHPDATTHRRYHKVMGHFRHYNNHDPAYSVWIEPHYRGDPALGITFTERDVSR